MIKPIPQQKQLFWFGVIGTVGFIVDFSILNIMMYYVKVDSFLSRIVSFLAAVTVTWLFNRKLTFVRGDKPSVREWGAYVSSMVIGATANYAIYAAILLTVDADYWTLLAAVAAGSIGGLSINFLTARQILGD